MRDYAGFLPNFSTGFKSASGRRFRRQTGEPVSGCTDPMAMNFDSNAEADDGSCIYSEGCTNVNADNFNANAEIDDGSCIFPEVDYGIGGSSGGASSSDGNYIGGCLNYEAQNFNPNANYDDGSCFFVGGCTNVFAINYDPSAQFDDGSCAFSEAVYYGDEFQDTQVEGASSSDGNYIGGCLNTMGQNFNPNANYDDGSCIFVGGCTDPLAVNYDASAQFDDGSCVIIADESGFNPPSTGTNVGDLLDELADAAGGPTGGASGGSSGGMVTDSEGFFEKDPKSRQRKKPKNRFSGFAGRDECGFVSSGFQGDVFTEGAPPSQPYIASVASV